MNQGLTMCNDNSAMAMNDIIKPDKKFQCNRNYHSNSMEFICSNASSIVDLEIDDLDLSTLNCIEFLNISAENNIEGRLTTIPSNICRFTKLKNLDLSFNKIQNASFNFKTPCLPKLQILHLSNNSLTKIPVKWFNQMPLLEHIDLQSNNLTDLPYDTFNNISQLRVLNIARNHLSSIELWTIQVRDKVDYQSNKINRFSNKYNVDLSHLQSRNIPKFLIDENLHINFDDTIFPMFNRCAEVHNIPNFFTTYIPTLTLAVLSIIKDKNHEKPFHENCACEQFYFYQTAFAVQDYPNNKPFEKWICPRHSIPFVRHCNNRSYADFTRVMPRFCKIDDSEPGNVPVYTPDHKPLQNTTKSTISTTLQTTTTTMNLTTTTSNYRLKPEEILEDLKNITVLDRFTIKNFTDLINNAHNNLNETDLLEDTRKIYQEIIKHIEKLIESINSTLHISHATVALVSSTKINPIYHLTQFILSNSSITYSSESDHDDSTASISIDQEYINQLSEDNIYSFYFLPSSLFEYAQIDRHIEIISPIVGAHLPNKQPVMVQMSFHDVNSNRSSGDYSCAFWKDNQWYDTGCKHSTDPITNRHYCQCNHLTSFALIFTPNGTLRETFLPTIITSCLSMIGLCISIILSVYQQTKPQAIRRSRHLPIINIFSLSSILILFILVTSLLIINYQSSRIQSTTLIACQSSKLNLVLVTYFFIILTFVTKTLLGIYYYFTTFADFKLHLFNDRLDKWYLVSLFMIIIIALIPTIVASALAHQSNNVIVSNNNVCWFDKIYLIKFITIPVSIFIGINMIIVILITIRLFQFLCYTNVDQAKEKRLITATCIWIASCILLGILWVVGPLLDLFVNDNGQSTSTASQLMQWFFALLTGLEGVWILIVNILFYLRQRPEIQSRRVYSPKGKRKWCRIIDFARVSIDTNDNQEDRYDFSLKKGQK